MLSPNTPQGQEPAEQQLLRIFPAYISQGTRTAMMELCMNTSPDLEVQKEFAEKLLAYTRDFTLRDPEIAQALFLGEELGGEGKQKRMSHVAAAKYHGRDIRRGEIWNGAGEHSLTVGMFAEILAQKIDLTARSIQQVTVAGGVHDWWKKHEIIHMWDAEDDLAGKGLPVLPDTMDRPNVIMRIRRAFDSSKAEDVTGLRALGLSEQIISLANSSRLRDVNGPQTDEELIICFLDHVMAGVRPMNMIQRIQSAVNGNPSYAAYEKSFRDELGGRTAHQLMLKDGLGEKIQRNIADRIGYTGELSSLHEYITQLFIDAVAQYEVTPPVPPEPVQ